ncbi:MAG: type II toxin-antitoxin system RelE/ParE family toxin, partial [Chitinophagaceae bacterium]|nr:type II toxin-antitoxin system RelE/ParE family toxin [Chitinophagaceae bacterium]
MLFHVIVTRHAHHDALEAYRYYEEKQQGLGERFLNNLEDCFSALSTHPEHYGYIAEDPLKVLRDVKIEKFPFVVVFEIRDTEVVVYAIHNTY